jgi:hypothetical protein
MGCRVYSSYERSIIFPENHKGGRISSGICGTLASVVSRIVRVVNCVLQFCRRVALYLASRFFQRPSLPREVLSSSPLNRAFMVELRKWFVGEKGVPNFTPLAKMDFTNCNLFSGYLEKLKLTAGYVAGGESRQNVVLRVQLMLMLANENEDFRNILLSLLEEASSSCGDRTLLYFNDIEVAAQPYVKKYTEQEFAVLAGRIQRYYLLKSHAKEEMGARELRDEVQTILYYQIHLKNDLHLPITTHRMLYPALAGVDYEMLDKARSEIKAIPLLDLLASSELWRTRLGKNHAEQFIAIENESVERLNNLPDDLADRAYQTFCDSIRDERERKLKELTKQLTLSMRLNLEWGL